MNKLLEFLKSLKIDLSESKFKEILSAIKQDYVDLEICTIDFFEFKELMNKISMQTIVLTLKYLGISKSLLIKALIVSVIYLIIVIAFVLIGVKAFAIPGTFAAIINATFPILGAIGLNKNSINKQAQLLNTDALITVVRKALSMLQSRKI